MKILSLLFSLLLGAAVLLFFLQPWDRLEKMLGDTSVPEAAAPQSTAAMDTAPPKPAEAAPPVAPAVAPNAPTDPKTNPLASEKPDAKRSVALEQKADPAVISEVQRNLTAINEYQGEINGKLDSVTVNAVQAFQRTANLKDDGLITETTRQKLAAAAARPKG